MSNRGSPLVARRTGVPWYARGPIYLPVPPPSCASVAGKRESATLVSKATDQNALTV